MRRTKIVCTLGPATSSQQAIENLIVAGADVVRLNFSHGDHESHRLMIKRVRKTAEKCNKAVAILQDLQGPRGTGLSAEETNAMIEKLMKDLEGARISPAESENLYELGEKLKKSEKSIEDEDEKMKKAMADCFTLTEPL